MRTATMLTTAVMQVMFWSLLMKTVPAILTPNLHKNDYLIYQKWLMIIKPVSTAPGWEGTLVQDDIDRATEAFETTWPQTISEITKGQVLFETEVIVSDLPLENITESGMVTDINIPAETEQYAVPANYDGIAIYNAFSTYSYWGNSDIHGVGWFSVNNRPDLEYRSDGVAGWIHESLHTMAWYFWDENLGPCAPVCPESPDGADGTHCGAAYGYDQDSNRLPYWMGWYQDYLLGVVDGTLGLGPTAWALGSRRETAQGLPPGSLAPDGNSSRRARRPPRMRPWKQPRWEQPQRRRGRG